MKAVIAAVLMVVSVAAYAACSTHSYTYNGRFVTCTTCCYGGNCTTNCY